MRNILDQIKSELGYSNAEDAEDLEMLEMAEYYDDLDAEEFAEMLEDAEENAEYVEFLEMLEDAEKRKVKRGGGGRIRQHLPMRHKETVKSQPRRAQLPKRNAHKKATNQALRNTGGGGNFQKIPATTSGAFVDNLIAESRGDLNITVIRQSINLAFNLPYILFGLNGFQSSFISTIRPYLPAGVTMSASSDAATGDMLLTYTDGVNTDIVRITLTGSQISYMEFLENMNSNFFKTKYIRQEYPNNKNLLNAVSQSINFGLLSALGARSANNLLPRARRKTSDFNTFIVDLFMSEQKITSDFSFVQKITQDADAVIAWDVVMSHRVNLNNI